MKVPFSRDGNSGEELNVAMTNHLSTVKFLMEAVLSERTLLVTHVGIYARTKDIGRA